MSMRVTLRAAMIAASSLTGIPLDCVADAEGITTKWVASGTTWKVAATTTLARLTIADGAAITAPVGHSLTMTVNGVETPVKAGTYKGDVVLTPAKDIDITFDAMGIKQTYKYRTAIHVDNGAYGAEKSVAAGVIGGLVTDRIARNIKITSMGERFNGVVVGGDSRYRIENATIKLNGNGKNDFNGVGAAIRAGDSSEVTIEGAHINNTGAVRTAIWVGDHGVVTINNSKIEVHDGALPEDYGWSWSKGGSTGNGDVMMEVPWMLGIRGNNRATLVVGGGVANYNNTLIRADAWGAVSTDAAGGPGEGTVNLTKCRVETVKSGYGAYADSNKRVHASGTVFDVVDYGLIMSGGSAVFTDGSVVKSRRIGVMAHDVTMPGAPNGTLTIDKGSVFNTEKAVIQLKSMSPAIVVDSAELHSKSGMILQVMDNDDPDRPASAQDNVSDVVATFRKVRLDGDFVNSRTGSSGMNLTFEDSTVTGAITTASVAHASGPRGEKLVMQDAPDLYYLIGEVNETYGATANTHGASVTLARSKWKVSKTSYLNGLVIDVASTVVAPAGNAVHMTVDGQSMPIQPGEYKGQIVLMVAEH